MAVGTESDEDLYERVRAGDVTSFDRLYARYERNLFGFVLAVTGSRADAEDVFHEAFMATLRAEGLRFEAGGFRAYLYTCAKNLARKRLKKAARDEVLDDEPSDPDPRPSAEHVLERRELEGALEDAVRRLSKPLAAVYHLRVAGLSYEEMASLLEIPTGTIKSRMSQLVHRLQRELAPWIAP
ncbi:MAG: sigma-70 family RNA polymerase sigma factor [Polyangiaceae bacterium]